MTYSDDTPYVSYTYNEDDRLTQMTDGIGTWLFGYDANSRLTSVDGHWDADTITSGYDDLGRLATTTPQGGTPLTYLYDSLNRLTQIQLGAPGTAYSYTYPGASPLVQSLTRPNGSATTYQYDLLTRLTDIANTTSTSAVITQHTFTYNPAGLRDSETMTGGPELPTLADEDTTSTYNPVNHLTESTDPERPTYTYDNDGNMTQGYTLEGYVFTATYDAENRLTAVEYADNEGVIHRTEYQYDGDGMLAIITPYENGALMEEIRIVRDGFLAIQDRDGNHAVLNEYTWGLNLGGGIGGLLNLKQDGQEYSYLYDGKGNVGAVLDVTQTVVAAYLYDPFGMLLAKTGSLNQPFQFSTKRSDERTGLSYYGLRFYAPEISRWMTRDPLGEAGGLNLYAFVGNNPVNWVDPWGERTGSMIYEPLQFPEPWDMLEGGGGRAAIGGGAGIGLGMLLRHLLSEALDDADNGNDTDDESATCPTTEDDYPVDPDEWVPPKDWTETNAGEKTGGRHRQWIDENGNIRRRWDREGRHGGKERGPHWHDSRYPHKHIIPK